MPLEFCLQVCVAALSFLGTMLMGLGERDATLPMVSLIVSVTAVYFTDYLKWFRLNTTLANFSGLFAVLLALQQVGTTGREIWLLAVAHLLAYLQFILLYQKKTERHYWLLMMLSLFQVAVAAALNLEIWFGLLLVVYLLLGLACMSLFFLYRERRRFEREISSAEPTRRRKNELLDGIQLDRKYLYVGWWFSRRVLWLGCLSLLLAGGVFLLTPRYAEEKQTSIRWSQQRGPSQAMVGFSGDVDINDLGPTLQNPAPVLKLWLSDVESGEPLPQLPEVRLRGSLLSYYRSGKWQSLGGVRQSVLNYPLPDIEGNQLVRQEIELQPLSTDALFGIYPLAPIQPRVGILQDNQNWMIERPREYTGTQYRYALYTWGFKNNQPLKEMPHYEIDAGILGRKEKYEPRPLDPREYRRFTSMPRDRGFDPLTKLHSLSAEVTEPLPLVDDLERGPFELESSFQNRRSAGLLRQFEALDPEVVRSTAQRIESYLRDSGEYTYTLNARTKDRSLDPVEDFLINRKAGHCEYFATALALMLRSQKIPARVVNGFAGGEWNEIGQFYQFRQYHAHSWVECYLPGGTWVTLDATPSAQRQQMVASVEPMFPEFRQWTDFVESVWAAYVLGLDPKRQQEEIYEPIQSLFADLWLWASYTPGWKRFFGGFAELWPFGEGSLGWRAWLSWRGVVVASIGLHLLWSLIRFFHWWIVLWWPGQSLLDRESEEQPVENLFERLELLLARYDIFRSHGETPREFGKHACEALREWLGEQPLQQMPQELVQTFYLVRYGQQKLPPDRFEHFDQQINELHAALLEAVREQSEDESFPTEMPQIQVN